MSKARKGIKTISQLVINMTQDAGSKIEFTITRQVTAELIERATRFFEKELASKTIDPVNYADIARLLKKEFGVNETTIIQALRRAFPREKISAGIAPARLARNYIRRNPNLKVPRKLRKAEEILAREPSISYVELAKRVGLSPRTITKNLRRIGVGRISSAERGRRTLRGREETPVERKEKYRSYFPEKDVLMAKKAIDESKGNLSEARKKLARAIGDARAKNLMNTVFPNYLVEKIGVEECANRFIAWVRTKPRIWTEKSKEHERYRKTRAYRERENRLVRERYHLKKAIELTAAFLEECVSKDSDIEQKDLFLEIAREILQGTNAVKLSLKKDIDEKVIIGVRRRMLYYLFSQPIHQPLLIQARERVREVLNATRFHDTFTEKWVSPENQPLVSRMFTITPEGIIKSTRKPIETAFAGVFGKGAAKRNIRRIA